LDGCPLLDTIRQPADLRNLEVNRLPALAEEIRRELLRVVSVNGGHLASNLGAVELTIALLRSFDISQDRIVWDTGHQAYTYKLLTGRRELFERLRQDDGCSGFPCREESPYDAFGTGHAGTAISAALGLAAARDRAGRDSRIVAVVGDGALGTGVSLEGLNSIIETTRDFTLVLNDNRMAIAPNVGAISRYLNRIIAGERYNRYKPALRDMLCRIPKIGPGLRRAIHRLEEATKSVLVPGVLFEELGLRYIGPLDGHDLHQLIETLESVRRLRQPIVVHVLTEKGHGYPHAEKQPEIFHGLGSFDVGSGEQRRNQPDERTELSFSKAFGQALCDRLKADPNVVVITAGMCHGTGLRIVREKFPDRLHDVGIAEEHAVVLAAGMAAAGLRPVLAVYATFMQRAFDYVFHDVCLQNLPVVFCLDRAGIVSDGPTHHGIHDLGFWRTMPNLTVVQPADGPELQSMLGLLLGHDTPGIIRYPRGNAAPLPVTQRAELKFGRAEVLRDGKDLAIWGLGREAAMALSVADDLAAQHNLQATVVNPRFVLPFDAELLQRQLRDGLPVVVLENHCVEGGFASLVKEVAAGHGPTRVLSLGWPRQVIPWGSEDGLRHKFGLDREQLVSTAVEFVRG